MSDREKKLLIFFGIAGFVILNFLAFNFAQAKRANVNAENAAARAKLEAAEMFREKRDQITNEMDWLAKHEPEPAADQDVQTKLQQFAESKATAFGLTIKSQKAIAHGHHRHLLPPGQVPVRGQRPGRRSLPLVRPAQRSRPTSHRFPDPHVTQCPG